MRPPPRLVRRVLIDPLWVPLAIAVSVLLVAIALVAAILSPVTPKRRVVRAAMLACVYLYLDLGLMLGGARLWLRHPARHRDEHEWRSQHTALLARALTRLMAAAHRLFGYDVQFVGSEPRPEADRPLIVLARHAGPGDSFTLVHLLATRFHRNPRVILKQALQWDPGLDVVLTRLRCHFLPSRSGAGEDRAAAVAELSRELDPGDALLLFPEGGNWTPRRHRRSVVRLLKAGRRREAARVQARTTVLPPRPGGTVAALAARTDTDVLDPGSRGSGHPGQPRTDVAGVAPSPSADAHPGVAAPCSDRPTRGASHPQMAGRPVGCDRPMGQDREAPRLKQTLLLAVSADRLHDRPLMPRRLRKPLVVGGSADRRIDMTAVRADIGSCAARSGGWVDGRVDLGQRCGLQRIYGWLDSPQSAVGRCPTTS